MFLRTMLRSIVSTPIVPVLISLVCAAPALAQQARVFVTSSVHDGNLGGLSGADAICTQRALDGGLAGGPWVAWLSTPTTRAVDGLTPTSGPFLNIGSSQVADDVSDLTDRTLDAAVLLDEDGVAPLVDKGPWTGTNAAGLATANTCAGWTTASPSVLGFVGQEDSASSSWTELFLASCDQARRLYCFEAPAGPALPSVDFYRVEPRAVSETAPVPVELAVNVTGTPSLVQLVGPVGPPLPLVDQGGGLYTLTLSGTAVLDGHVAGERHSLLGFLELYVSTGTADARVVRQHVLANIRQQGIPVTAVHALDTDAQASAHVLNLREDLLWTTGDVPPEILQRFYTLYEDGADFVAVVSQVRTKRNRSYIPVRNTTDGIGLPLFDDGATWSSASRLQGIVQFPLEDFFDLAAPGAVHEIGHRWAASLQDAELVAPGPHWPISTLANSVMGYDIPGSGGVGGVFPFQLVVQPSGDYLVQSAPRAIAFNDLELYLLGLTGTPSVSSHFVLQDQDQSSQLFVGGVLQGPADEITIGDIVGVNGPRVPAGGSAQTHFTLATIVLSDGRLLNQTEMDFFEHMSARGGEITDLPYDVGLDFGVTKPFGPATQNLATFSTLLPCLAGTGPDGDGSCPATLPALPAWALLVLALFLGGAGYRNVVMAARPGGMCGTSRLIAGL